MAAPSMQNFIHFRSVRDPEPKGTHSLWNQTGLHRDKEGGWKRIPVSLGSQGKKT